MKTAMVLVCAPPESGTVLHPDISSEGNAVFHADPPIMVLTIDLGILMAAAPGL